MGAKAIVARVVKDAMGILRRGDYEGGEEEETTTTPAIPDIPASSYETATRYLKEAVAILRGGGGNAEAETQDLAPSEASSPSSSSLVELTTMMLIPSWWTLKVCFGIAITLHVMNQKHLLPKPLATIVSKVMFWPTMPFTALSKMGTYATVIDETVVLGAAPIGGIVNFPGRLYNEYKVRGVINLCNEYSGPDGQYRRLGISHLRLPTVDHFEPSVADLERGVAFIKRHQKQGTKVYVHCKGGHGRSAAIVFAWLMYKDPNADLEELNREFCLIRKVRKKLYRQPNILTYQAKLLERKYGVGRGGGGTGVGCKVSKICDSETELTEQWSASDDDDKEL